MLIKINYELPLTLRDRFWMLKKSLRAKLSAGSIYAGLQKWWRLYIGEQIHFFRNVPAGMVHCRPRLAGRVWLNRPTLPAVAADTQMLIASNVDVISERQYVFDESGYYVYFPGTNYRSIKNFFPALTLYDVEVRDVFGSYVFCCGNYYHTVIEYFFQVFLLLSQSLKVRALWMGRPSRTEAKIIAILEAAGVEFLIAPARLSRVRAQRFWVFPAQIGRIWCREAADPRVGYADFQAYVALLRQGLGLEREVVPHRRIYASRGDTARLSPANNPEVEELFRRHGFEVVRFGELRLEEQARVASEAMLMVGIHGANLTNCIFMPPGARLVEMRPRSRWEDNAYRLLSAIGCLDYHLVPLPQRGDSLLLPELEEMLRGLDSPSGQGARRNNGSPAGVSDGM